MSETLDKVALLDAERASEIAKNDEAMRQEDAQIAGRPACAPRLLAPVLAFAAAAALTACAGNGPEEDASRADVHCTIEQLVPIEVGDQVLMVPGHCIAWEVGPTAAQQRAFEQLHGRGGAL